MKTREERIARQEELLRFKDAVEARLLAIPGARSADTGFNEAGGKSTDEIVLRVYVMDKRPIGEVPPSERIPAVIAGIPTDVVVWTHHQEIDDTARYRPLRGGIQITNGVGGNGTLGCFGKRQSN